MDNAGVRPAVAAIVMVLLAACGEGPVMTAQSVGDTTDSTTTTTDTTADPTTSTVETTAGSTTTTAAAITTTSTTAPAALDGIVVVSPQGVLGWWDGAAWRAVDEGPVPVRAGDTYRIVTVDEPIRTAMGGAPDEGCQLREDDVGVPIDGLGWDGERFRGGVAVTGEHDLVPRPVRRVEPVPTEHVDAARAMLAAQGLRDPDPVVRESIVADLDGDGVDEVIVVADHGPRQDFDDTGQTSASVVLLRRLADGRVVDQLIAADAPAQRGDHPPPHVRYHLQVSAIADLDGDGVMELVLEDQYYEGAGAGIHVLTADGMPSTVFTWCGA